MAGAVAFSFVLALFPFCIFLGAFAGYFGGESLARAAVAQLFEMVPDAVAKVLEPEVMAVMGKSRLGLLTFGALIALFFATSAIESLRAALNVAYREKETKSYPACLLQSMILVMVSALGMLAIAWGVVVGPQLLSRIKPGWLQWLSDQSWTSFLVRYAIVLAILAAQLFTYHLWLAAGRRRVADVWPGVVLSHRVLDRVGQAVRRLAAVQRLLALLCRPHLDHERTGVLPGDGDRHHSRRRAQSRHDHGPPAAEHRARERHGQQPGARSKCVTRHGISYPAVR